MPLPKKNLPTKTDLSVKDSTTKTVKKRTTKKVKKKTSDNIDEETKELRESPKWKFIYEKELQSFGMLRGGTKDKEERFLKYIDKLASLPPVNQHNIMDSYAPFISLSKKDRLRREDKK